MSDRCAGPGGGVDDETVDRVCLAMCNAHDGTELWEHTRRDPENFRGAVRAELNKLTGEINAVRRIAGLERMVAKTIVRRLSEENVTLQRKLDRQVIGIFDDRGGMYFEDATGQRVNLAWRRRKDGRWEIGPFALLEEACSG